MTAPIVNPEIPYNGEIPGGLRPGKMIRLQGITHPNSDRFNINLQTGPTAKPRDDTALHVSVRLNQGYIARNTYKDGEWGDEQGGGILPIGQAQSFEIIILVDPNHFKIAVNGQHFCEFPHRIPYEAVSHILIDGDVSITLISFEGSTAPGGESASQASQLNAVGPQGAPPMQYGPPPGGYGPPPNYGGPQGYGPPPPPGAQPESEFGGFLESAQDMLAGAIKSGAAEKLLGSILSSSGGQQQQQQAGYAPQNARYGIYPDLPTEDTTVRPQNPSNPSAADAAISGLIAESGGTVIQGPQPPPPGQSNFPQNTQGGQQNQPGPLESLLQGLLSGNAQQKSGNQQAGGVNQPQSNQQGGSDLLAGLLSSLLSGSGQQQGSQAPGGPAQPQYGGNQAQQGQGDGSNILSGILSNLLSSSKDQQPSGTPDQPQNPQYQGNQPQKAPGGGSDMLSGILSSLLSGNKDQQTSGSPNQPRYAPQNPQQQGNQTNVPQSAPPQNTNELGQQNNAELLTNLLSGLLAKAGEQQRDRQGAAPPQPPQGVAQPQNQPRQSPAGSGQPQDAPQQALKLPPTRATLYPKVPPVPNLPSYPPSAPPQPQSYSSSTAPPIRHSGTQSFVGWHPSTGSDQFGHRPCPTRPVSIASGGNPGGGWQTSVACPVGYPGYPFPASQHRKKPKKSRIKKAMQYGLPVVGAAVAAYALSKASKRAFKCNSSTSSSSSSGSSSDSD